MDWHEDVLCGSSQIFGFWHEDSFFMNLVLKKLSHRTAPVDVIVTADTRGDYIEYMIGKSGGRALRVPDGLACIGAVKKLMKKSYEEARSLAIALDGPLGPRHEPKKLAFYLSEQRQEDFVGISVSYSSCLRVVWRWDQYAVPLPFSRVTVDVRDYGMLNKRSIPELPVEAASDAGISWDRGEQVKAERNTGMNARGTAAGRLVMDALRYSSRRAACKG